MNNDFNVGKVLDKVAEHIREHGSGSDDVHWEGKPEKDHDEKKSEKKSD